MSELTKNTKTAPTLGVWIKSALSFGTNRKLIVAQEPDQFVAILDFGDIPSPFCEAENFRCGAVGKTPADALAALDNALMEGAANDMVKAGDV